MSLKRNAVVKKKRGACSPGVPAPRWNPPPAPTWKGSYKAAPLPTPANPQTQEFEDSFENTQWRKALNTHSGEKP